MKHALRFALAVFALASFAAAANALPVTYKTDAAHTEVGFDIRHFFAKVHGRFNTFDATIVYDDANPANISVEGTADTKSINTQNDKRDAHLRSTDFFAADSFPTLTFKSTKVTQVDKTHYKITGDLTMRGVTKSVTFDAEFVGAMTTGMGAKAGFSATAVVNRQDYGIKWNKTLDNGGMMLSDDVTIVLNIEGNGPAKK